MGKIIGKQVMALLVVTILLSSIGLFFIDNATALDPEENSEVDYTFSVNEGLTGCTITGYAGSGGEISIPSTLGGYPVTEIGWGAFEGCINITSVVIPNSVTKITAYAFARCTSLVSVNIPDSVTLLDAEVFDGCSSLISVNIPIGISDIYFNTFRGCTSLKSIEIPPGVTSIGECAFFGCTNLTDLKIANSVGLIWYYAFANCTSLLSFTFPGGTYWIEGWVLNGCTSLRTIVLPSGVGCIWGWAFSDCPSLYDIEFLGLKAPNTVIDNWINNSAANITGHAYGVSDFPTSGNYFHGLLMGESLIGNDSTPPTTSERIIGDLNENGVYNDSARVMLGVTDDLSGFSTTFYRLDGGNWTGYENAIIIDSVGNHSLDYYSVDKAGNVENVQHLNIVVDSTSVDEKPQCTLIIAISFVGLAVIAAIVFNVWRRK